MTNGFNEAWLKRYQQRHGTTETSAPERMEGRWAAGRADDLGDYYFKSSWERNIGRYLNWLVARGEIFRWEYEPDTFWFKAILRGVRSYKPDFKVWEREDSVPYYIEVKGYMDARSKTKLRRMKKYYPTVRVDVLDAAQYRALAQTIGPLLPHWEQEAGGRFGGQRKTLI